MCTPLHDIQAEGYVAYIVLNFKIIHLRGRVMTLSVCQVVSLHAVGSVLSVNA